jgi:hypothetical protein
VWGRGRLHLSAVTAEVRVRVRVRVRLLYNVIEVVKET